MAVPTILRWTAELRRWSERTVILDCADEPVLIEVLPTYLRLIRAAWDASPSTADVARAESRVRDADACRTCGGSHVVPTWVGEFLRYGQPSMPTYGIAEGMQPMACPSSCATANVGTWSPLGADQADCDKCALCSGTGLLPEWAAMAIEEGDHEPRWLAGRHLEGRYWFASYCRVCAGWGYAEKMGATAPAPAPLPGASSGASPQSPQVTAMPQWFWHILPNRGWRVGFGGQVIELPELKGFTRIAELLNHPGRTYPAIEWSTGELDVLTEQIVDPKALTAVRNKIKDLDDQIDSEPDLCVREELQAKRAHLSDWDRKNSGLGGKPRMGKSAAKNARDREANAIKRAIEKLDGPEQSDLATYLSRTIKCGSEFLFQPLDGETWDVKQG